MQSIVRMTLGAGALAAALAGAAQAQGDSPYMRVVEEDAQTVRLDIAVRTLAPADGEGPLVNLVGAIHIGDASFYDAAQAILDVHDVVLYEGVGGGREPAPEPRGDQAAAAVTERRVRFLSVLAGDARRRDGEFPDSAEELAGSAGEPLQGLVGAALVDGWGRPFEIGEGESFDIVSLGADGEEGGTGADADVRASEILAKTRVVATAEESAGLQRDLADALGLVFQLDGIDYSGAHWRNSDLSVGEIQKALGGREPGPGDRERGPDEPLDPDAPESLKAADYLFRTLSGESFLAKASGFLLRMLGSSASGRVMVKLMLADMLTHAEDLLAMQPGALADLMKVIVEDRNTAVIRDLGAVIEDEPQTRTVAVFYGAGHFGDLEQRIEDELGYEHVATLWVPAITIDLEEAGLNVASVRPMRKMMGDMIEAQMKALEADKK
jgi:hypothetical protein